MITVSAFATTLFLGGWRAPWPITQFWDGANSGWWPLLWWLGKVLILLFGFIWLRATLPRMRYDQFMRFGWKVLIPVNLVWILFLAGVRVANNELSTRDRWLVIGGIVVAVLLVAMLWPAATKPRAALDRGAAGRPATGQLPGPADGSAGAAEPPGTACGRRTCARHCRRRVRREGGVTWVPSPALSRASG